MAEKPVYIIGHKNPDTDSICSAIAYAHLRNRLENTNKYVAMRAGHTNAETKYVLSVFDVEKPKYLDSLEPKLSDVTMRKTDGIDAEASLKVAYQKMKDEQLKTLPVFKDGEMVGLITSGDIARSMMEEHGTRALSSSAVSCQNILDTLDGELLVGDKDAVFKEGPIAIGAANPELMIKGIEPHAMVIMGNRADAQISALEQGADWMIVCLGSEVFDIIKEAAEANHCNIIVTPHTTYQVARLINQSMPVRHVMCSDGVIGFKLNDSIDDVKKEMTKQRIRYFPVYDANDKFVGLVSQRNLLNYKKQQVILVDHNEVSQSVYGIEQAEVIEIIDHHRIGGFQTSAPVGFRNQPLGCTATIIAIIYRENNMEIEPAIAGIMCSAIISDTLCFKSPTCTPLDEKIARELAEIAGINVEEHATEMFKVGSAISDKSDEEIFYQDYKNLITEGYTIGAGQVTVMGDDTIEDLKKRLIPYMKETVARTHLDMAFLMLTDVINEYSVLLFAGEEKTKNLKDIVHAAFGVEPEENSVLLPKVVSRKKQLIPQLSNALQNL